MSNLHIRQLGPTGYEATWQAMQALTAERNLETVDEFWVTEHAPVYTLGLNRRNVRMPQRDDIPVVLIDRGGKITYHGPGQLIVYLLVDLKRKALTVRQLVSAMEQAIVDLLGELGVSAVARPDAPGVYVDGRKIASLGLRLKHNCSYHGLALNIDMDLSPFAAIDPCGYEGLQVTQLRDLGIDLPQQEISIRLLKRLAGRLNYTKILTHTS